MKIFREIADLRRFRGLPRAEKRIVFYAEHEGYFPYFEGLIIELTEARQVPICYLTSDPDDPVLDEESPRRHVFYVNKLLPYFMLLLKCRVLVMTLTDLNQFYLKRSLHPVHYLYVFHSMVSTHMMYRAGAFDHYDSILCVGPYHLAEIRAGENLSGSPPKHLIEAGFYRLERIHAEYQARAIGAANPDRQKTVLIAPSWGQQNLLKSCGSELVKLMLDSGWRVIVRPHPETFRRDPGLITSLKNAFGDKPDFELEASVGTDQSLLVADILICDLSGVALEYAFGTERPVLFIDVPYKVHNPGYRELDIEPIELALRAKIGEVVSPDKLETVLPTISKLLSEHSRYRSRLAQLREKCVFNFGRSAEIGARRILDIADAQEASVKRR